MGGFQNRPRAIVCQGCGGQYFTASLPIHQKTCFQRNEFVDIACSKCRGVVKSGRYHEHVAKCTGSPPDKVPFSQSQPPRRSRPEVSADQLNAPEADGRIRCRKCDRGFHHERIAKHQSVCAGSRWVLRDERPKSETEGQPTRRAVVEDRRTPPSRPATQSSSVGRATLPSQMAAGVPRASGLNAVRMKLAQTSLVLNRRGSGSRQAPSPWEARPNSTHYDLVHRDFNATMASSGHKLNNLSTSTATSAANPLVTSTLMMVQRMW